MFPTTCLVNSSSTPQQGCQAWQLAVEQVEVHQVRMWRGRGGGLCVWRLGRFSHSPALCPHRPSCAHVLTRSACRLLSAQVGTTSLLSWLVVQWWTPKALLQPLPCTRTDLTLVDPCGRRHQATAPLRFGTAPSGWWRVVAWVHRILRPHPTTRCHLASPRYGKRRGQPRSISFLLMYPSRPPRLACICPCGAHWHADTVSCRLSLFVLSNPRPWIDFDWHSSPS
jgi:hypothetical protein